MSVVQKRGFRLSRERDQQVRLGVVLDDELGLKPECGRESVDILDNFAGTTGGILAVDRDQFLRQFDQIGLVAVEKAQYRLCLFVDRLWKGRGHLISETQGTGSLDISVRFLECGHNRSSFD